MKFIDRVYDEVAIDDPVIIEIINDPAFQRLKNIDQIGYSATFFPGAWHSRFEHSLGVYILLRKFGAPQEEQIAGLIHDISHSVFSHCIDYALKTQTDYKQEHQDNIFASYIRKTTVAGIIKKYNFDLDYILNDKNFPLKENDLPDLCADRIDYSLRTAVIFGELKNPGYFLDSLIVKNNRWIFQNFESAKKYALLFYKLNRNYYANIIAAKMFRAVGDYLRHALQKKYIIPDDLYTTDSHVLMKIQQYHIQDKTLLDLYKRMNNRSAYKSSRSCYDVKVVCKSRVVDPLCIHQGKIKRISEVQPSWKKVLKEELKPKSYFLKLNA